MLFVAVYPCLHLVRLYTCACIGVHIRKIVKHEYYTGDVLVSVISAGISRTVYCRKIAISRLKARETLATRDNNTAMKLR